MWNLIFKEYKMETLILGGLVALSIIILIRKLEKHKWDSLIVDGIISIGLMLLFAHTFVGLAVSVIAGLILSIYFYYREPTWLKELKENLLKGAKNDRT